MKDRPETDLETVKDLELEGTNFSISNKRVINCKFISCNILYSGGNFHLDGNSFDKCKFWAMGPIADALTNVVPEEIKRKLTKSWDDLMCLSGSGVDDKGNIKL